MYLKIEDFAFLPIITFSFAGLLIDCLLYYLTSAFFATTIPCINNTNMYIDIYLYSMPYLTKNTFNLKHGSLLCDLPIETTKYYLISTTMGLVKIRSCQTHPSKLLLA